MITVTPSLQSGTYLRTYYNTNTSKIVLTPTLLCSSNPRDFLQTGSWTFAPNGAATPTRPTDSEDVDLHQNSIYVNQSVVTPLVLRAIISATDIENYDVDQKFILKITFYEATGGWQATILELDCGTYDERQFTLRLVHSRAIEYAWPKVELLDKKGSFTVRQIEFFEEATSAVKYGEWSSDIIDVTTLTANTAATEVDKLSSCNLLPVRGQFYYEAPEDVDDLGDEDYSFEQLAKSEFIVTFGLPAALSARGLVVINRLIAAGVKIFGYTSGILYPTPTDMQAPVDAIAATNPKWYGVFMDSSPTDRADQNTITDYVHSKGLKFFPNLTTGSAAHWFEGSTPAATHLTHGDFGLIESFYIRSDNSYGGEAGGEHGFNEMMYKWDARTVRTAHAFGVKIVGLTYNFTIIDPDDMTEVRRTLYLASLLGLDYVALACAPTNKYILWHDWPLIKVGNTYSSALKRVSTTRWERRTDKGILWATGTGYGSTITRNAGFYNYAHAPLKLSSLSSADFTADGIELKLYGRNSPDSAWIEIENVTIIDDVEVAESFRYYQIKAILREA